MMSWPWDDKDSSLKRMFKSSIDMAFLTCMGGLKAYFQRLLLTVQILIHHVSRADAMIFSQD